MNLYLKTCHILISAAISASLLFTSCSNLPFFGPHLYDPVITAGFEADYRPKESTNFFYIDSPQVCCSIRLSGAHADTVVQASWVYEKTESQEVINEVILADNNTQGHDGYLGFTLNAPAQGFSSGQYRLDLSVDDSRQMSIPFSIKRSASGPLPWINNFSAEPQQIVSRETSKLSWNVAEAGRVSIEPSPGAVSSEGSIDIAPAADTVYTLWAVNKQGNTSSQITIAVKQPVNNKADLVITDFWNSGNILSYHIQNIGNLTSCATESYLYKNDTLVSSDYVAPLAPGEQRGGSFSKYHFSPRFPSMSASLTAGDICYMRICANGDGSCPEADYTNNCLDHNFGPLLNVNLLQYSSSAQWQSSAASLSWPMYTGSEDGWAHISTAQIKSGLSYPNALLMEPPASSGSWIQGMLGVPVDNPKELLPFTIPHDCKFSANVGLTVDTPEAANVKFILGTSQGGAINYFPPVTVNSGGELANYSIDLSGLAGQKVLFILRVESGGPLPEGSAAWIEPVISQQR
ncbi:MAG: CARDB domain-containing protein [Dehalococcoidia bacterium]|jgi:hypothetical protein